MQIEYVDMRDDGWRKAAEVAGEKWKTSLAPRHAARAVVKPLTSPDGAIVPYQLQVQTFKADGSLDWTGATIVWNGEIVSGKGRDAAVKYLHGAGFPGTHMPLGHLIEALFLTGAIAPDWLRPPVPAGWNALIEKVALIDELPAVLEYGKGTATLILNRIGATGAGGGQTPPPTERLTVRFKSDASMTIDASRRMSGSKAWEPFTP